MPKKTPKELFYAIIILILVIGMVAIIIAYNHDMKAIYEYCNPTKYNMTFDQLNITFTGG